MEVPFTEPRLSLIMWLRLAGAALVWVVQAADRLA